MARDHEEKLRSVMYLDSKKEKDLINYVAELKHSHKLGEYIAICIRTCWENPEILDKAGYKTEHCGMTEKRTKFFNDVNRQMNELRYKVNKIYDIALKDYSLAQFGKLIGLSEKSKNLLRTEFILRRQIDELSRILGVSNLSSGWESESNINTAKADELLELIIQSYDGIVSELKASLEYEVSTTPQTKMKQSGATRASSPIVSIPDVVPTEELEETKEFGDGADLAVLEQFLGI